MVPEPISYQESTGWPAWAAVLGAGACWAGAAAAARDALAQGGGAERWVPVAALAAAPALLWLAVGRLDVRVARSELRLSFGPLGLIRKTVPFADIRALEAVRYQPLLEFGGWGIRWGRGGKRAWTMKGSRALRLTLRDGKQLYVGSADPERLASRVRAAGGGRWAEAAPEPR